MPAFFKHESLKVVRAKTKKYYSPQQILFTFYLHLIHTTSRSANDSPHLQDQVHKKQKIYVNIRTMPYSCTRPHIYLHNCKKSNDALFYFLLLRSKTFLLAYIYIGLRRVNELLVMSCTCLLTDSKRKESFIL